MGGRRGAVGDSVGPILGQPVILRRRRQSAVRHRQSHRYVGPAAAHVIAPQGRDWLLDAALACNENKQINIKKQTK